MTEIWKPVVGYEGYEVSSLGRVRSIGLRVWNGKVHYWKPGRILLPGLASNGYYTVALRGKSRTVHSLVADAFLGLRPAGMEVRHLDGKRANCSRTNLAYGTRVENRADSERHGTAVRGSRYKNAKLDEAKARAVRGLKGKVTQKELARRYGVSSGAIQAVHDGRTWTHA